MIITSHITLSIYAVQENVDQGKYRLPIYFAFPALYTEETYSSTQSSKARKVNREENFHTSIADITISNKDTNLTLSWQSSNASEMLFNYYDR